MADNYYQTPMPSPTWQTNQFGYPSTTQPYNPYRGIQPIQPMQPIQPQNNYPNIATQPPSNTTNQNNSNVSWVYVPDISAVEKIIVVPNQTLYIMNQNKSEFYIKSTDSIGMATIKVCPFAVYDINEYQNMQQQQNENRETVEYITRNEYNDLVNNVNSQFATIQQNINMLSQYQNSNQINDTLPVPQATHSGRTNRKQKVDAEEV